MSVICSRFTQNAWKKDLCSNCFKAKEEHKAKFSTSTTTNQSRENTSTPKGIIKGIFSRRKPCKVNFSKDLLQVIGYGGEWSSSEAESEEEVSPFNDNDENTSAEDDDEDHKELNKITRKNTDFNTSNGNLLGDPADNIKKSFAALRLGTLQLDAEGKKKTLKISVKPFSSSLAVCPNQDNSNKDTINPGKKNSSSSNDFDNSPPIERAMEKSLLEEISETLEKNQKEIKKTHFEKPNKIMFEISSLSGPLPKVTTDYKKAITRSSPVTKESAKSKVAVLEQEEDNNLLNNKDESSHYYDVVDSNYSYDISNSQNKLKINKDIHLKTPKVSKDQSIFSSSQYITDMLLTAKTHSASYSLREGSFMTSKITSDGLIVTKCNSDDTLDSTASSFDGSSDEETSYNMNRSESDSGIGISIGIDFQAPSTKENKNCLRNSSSNYEDVKPVEENVSTIQKVFNAEKSRELAGEPDGSADPDGNLETSTVSQTTQALETNSVLVPGTQKRPEIPVKPLDVIKSLTKKAQFEQQTSRVSENLFESSTLSRKEGNEYSKLLRKGRAPNPPNVNSDESNNALTTKNSNTDSTESSNNSNEDLLPEQKLEENHSTLYTRNPINMKSSSPVIREKDKRERATVNPKFRSLNTCSKRANITSLPSPETVQKKLSMSEECLIENKKKKKFSIKKFLRIGTSKTTDNLYKKDGIYSEIITGDETNIVGKPRLVIIHPIDINPPGAVEVVKEVSKPPPCVEIMNVVSGKPPAPPQRMSSDGSRISDINKPARPPPPKSAELRRKQKFGFSPNPTGSVKSKMDNVYANLGEIRSAIAPRKPERTASMREREAQLELIKMRQNGEFSDTISVCSSKGGGSAPTEICLGQSTFKEGRPIVALDALQKKQSIGILDPKVRDRIDNKVTLRLETFERPLPDVKPKHTLNDGIRDSVLKINNTVDSYLKDKRQYESLYDLCSSSSRTGESVYKTHLSSESNFNRNYENANSRFQPKINVGDGTSSAATRSECGAQYELNNFVSIPRVVSTSYCGSELGESSEIYTPYSFYGSESGMEICNGLNEVTWGIQPMANSRLKTTNRLRMRKGRSVVHKTIEDNYSAVVVANHEALAQVLDQLQQPTVISPQLRPLASAINLRFEDFAIVEGVQAFVVGKRAFHAALWMTTPVTLALSSDCNQISGVSGELNQLSGGVSGALNPITEFCDLVPSHYLPLIPSTEVRMLQTTVSVLPRLQLDTLHSIGNVLKNKEQALEKRGTNFRESVPSPMNQKDQGNLRNVCSMQNLLSWNEEKREVPALPGMPSFDDVMYKEVGFIMLQLINGLKNLQAKGIEEIPISLSNVVLCQEVDNKETQARLCVLQGSPHDEEESMVTLCKCAYIALNEMLPKTKLTPILSEIFLKERSESLSKAKSVLEFILWGPSDVVLTGSTKEREQALQRWLDLERATVLHGLVRTRVELTVYDECHLMFLVRSNAKIMNEAFNIVAGFELSDI